MKLDELMYYGRYYRNEKTDSVCWFYDTYSDSVIHRTDLYNDTIISSDSECDFSVRYVQLFSVDIIDLEQKYIAALKNKKISTEFSKIKDEDFDRQFKIFIESENLERDWHEHEKQILQSETIRWGRENKIRIDR